MNLLRQKITQLQQEKEARSALAVERDEAHLAVRKLEKKVERMQKELSSCQEHNTELKAKLADTNELKASGWLLPSAPLCQGASKCTQRNGSVCMPVTLGGAGGSGVQSHSWLDG